MEMPKFGDRVRGGHGATGRYIGDGLMLFIAAQDNGLVVTEFDTTAEPPHPTLPVPGDEALLAALAGIAWAEGSTRLARTDGGDV